MLQRRGLHILRRLREIHSIARAPEAVLKLLFVVNVSLFWL